MRILHIGKYFYPEKGGIESYILILAKEFQRLGNEVSIIVSNTSRKRVFEKKDMNILRLPRFFYFFHQPITSPFFHLINKFEPNIIHFHVPNPYFEFNLFLYSLFFRKAKIIVTYHSDVVRYNIFQALIDYFRQLYLYPLLKLFSKKVIATSKNYVKGSAILQKLREKVVVIPLCIDTKKFKPKRVKKAQKNVLLFEGRLFPYKGLEYLIEAVKIISEERKDFILYIVGEGEMRKKLENLVDKLRISKFVKFTGAVSDKVAIKYYNICDLFILPSVYKSEAFGTSLLEAMACGKPAITTNIKGSGVPFVNQNGKTGIVVEPRNSKALANAILYLLDNKKLRRKMGRKARERVLKYFRKEKVVKKILKIYSE